MGMTALDLIIRSGRMPRAQFLERVTGCVGSPPVAGLVLDGSENATAVCPWSARVWTPDASVAGQTVKLGQGAARTMAAASSQYWTTPDTTNLSFGNGSNDSSFSAIALLNVNDTASNRTILSKFNSSTSNLEYLWTVTGAADKLSLNLYDQSAAAASASRSSDAAITQGAWRLFGFSYSGGGGATAADGIAFYDNGVVLASTATNNASYVAMENLDAPLEIGSLNAHTAQFFDGSMALLAIFTKTLTAGNMAALAQLVRQYYRVTL